MFIILALCILSVIASLCMYFIYFCVVFVVKNITSSQTDCCLRMWKMMNISFGWWIAICQYWLMLFQVTLCYICYQKMWSS